ncbi:hypothetical protein Plec18167_001900 [Paecilomyces lecythidis]|uniref:Spo12 family protein n=1 Tax=Paecilomyces lecythidis TaxID=3004212 RepID=A0ABR3YAU3_9EURO
MDATTAAQTQPLADRPTNTHLQSLEEKPQGTYVSPSDGIQSPCTKKLSDLKGKRFKNAGKPQSLFTKLSKKSYEQSSAAEEASAPREQTLS